MLKAYVLKVYIWGPALVAEIELRQASLIQTKQDFIFDKAL